MNGRTLTRTLAATRLPACAALALALLCAAVSAQTAEVRPVGAAVAVTASATARGVRFSAPAEVVRVQLEVLAESGDPVFDASGRGSVLDWALTDGAGQSVPDGSYLCVVTVKTLSGRLAQRAGSVEVRGGVASVRGAAEPTEAQRRRVGPLEEGSALSVVGDIAGAVGGVADGITKAGAPAVTLTGHDGRAGQVVSTAGALSFRLGDFFAGKDKEAMRLDDEGLTVAGALRAKGGIRFGDGTTLDTSSGRLTLTSAEGEEIPGPNAAGTGTLNKLAKWAETGGAGTLTDSTFLEDASGNVFNFFGSRVVSGGQQPFFEAQRQSATDIMQRFWNTGAGGAKLRYVAGTGATSQIQLTDNAEWLSAIAGNNAVGLQFRVRPSNATNSEAGLNQSAVMTLARTGNVGIGTTSPTARLEVAGGIKVSGAGNGVTFPDGTTQTTAVSVTLSGSGTTDTVPLWTGGSALGDSVITQAGGNVGIGLSAPTARLDVGGPVRATLGSSNNMTVETTGGTNAWARLWMNTPAQRWAWGTSRDFNGNQLYLFDDTFQQTRMTVNPAGGAISFPTGDVGIGTSSPVTKLHVAGALTLDAAGPTVYLGAASAEQNRYLHLVNSPSYGSAQGLKAGGLLVSDSFDYANPAKNQLVVKGTAAVGASSAPSGVGLYAAGAVVGVQGAGSSQGVRGEGVNYGVYGKSTNTSAINYGVYGEATYPYGFAGYFNGPVKVTSALQVENNLFVTGAGRFTDWVYAQEFVDTSDRNAKANFAAVNPRSVLQRLAAIPIQTWNYKSQPESVRHMGPMAQDFRAAFGLGHDDTHISSVDGRGVALAAIQGLYELVQEKERQIERLQTRLSRLERAAKKRRAGRAPASR